MGLNAPDIRTKNMATTAQIYDPERKQYVGGTWNEQKSAYDLGEPITGTQQQAPLVPETATPDLKKQAAGDAPTDFGGNKYTTDPLTGEVTMNWEKPGAISSSTERTNAGNDLDKQLQEIFGKEYDLTNSRYEQQVVDLNNQFNEQRQVTQEAQKSETGTTSLGLARMGGYLGGSGSGMGVMQNLAESQKREINLLEQKRQSALAAAATARNDQQLALAYKKIDEAKALEQKIYKRKQDAIDATVKYEADQQEQLVKTAKAQRDAFDFAMENDIKKPYYTLDGETYWDTASGQRVDVDEIGDESKVQIIDPSATPDSFETRTVDGRVVKFGFDKKGNPISRIDLGKAGTGTGGGSGGGTYGMTASEKKKYNELVQRIEAGADPEIVLQKASGSVYSNLKEYIEENIGTPEDVESKQVESRLGEYKNAGDWEKYAAYLYEIKTGKIEGDFEEEYKTVMKELAKGEGTGPQWRSRINSRIEYIETGTKPK